MSENISRYWDEKFSVASFQVDQTQRLTLTGFFYMFQEAAQNDASRRGWGYEEMLERGQFWVLLRVRIEATSWPVWRDKVALRTWPNKVKGIIAYRDFQLIGEDGKIYLSGTSVWTLLDQESRRPVRDLFGGWPPPESLVPDAIETEPKKIEWPDDLEFIKLPRIAWSFLDMNGHVNNTRYLEWIINELPEEVVANSNLLELDVNFIREAKLGDSLAVSMIYEVTETGQCLGYIRRETDKMPVYAIRMVFQT